MEATRTVRPWGEGGRGGGGQHSRTLLAPHQPSVHRGICVFTNTFGDAKVEVLDHFFQEALRHMHGLKLSLLISKTQTHLKFTNTISKTRICDSKSLR